MNDRIPYMLHEAVLSLYPAAADGQAIVAAPVWSGALATGLRMSMEFEEVKLQGAGERYTTAHHVDEEHVLTIDRTWLIRRAAPTDFVPRRNQQYVLEWVWYDSRERTWYQRQYFGVTARRVEWTSAGTNHFGTQQVWRAQRFVDNGGTKAGPVQTIYNPGATPPTILPGPYTPLPEAVLDAQTVPFFRENPMVVGDYLLGQYRWPVDVRLGKVQATAWASQGQDTVLGLEIDGVLVQEVTGGSGGATSGGTSEPTVDSTGVTVDSTTVTADSEAAVQAQVTLAAGSANTEVIGSVDIGGLVVHAGSVVRWQIVSGPIPEQAAWACALTMGVTAA